VPEQEWPQEGVDLRNKRIAVIGTGASGIQTIQECGPVAKHLTVYQRTPNYAVPMNQRPLDEKEQSELKKEGVYEKAFEAVFRTFAGFNYEFSPKKTFEDSPEERAAFYRNLLIEQGGFKFWLGTYQDMLFDQNANDEVSLWQFPMRSGA
jgi:cation diffusion facilitator CzcD-associated flavoprotein CzcO